MIDKIRKWRDAWKEQELKDEIDAVIVHPLEDFQKFLEEERGSTEYNKEYQALHQTERIIAKFREAMG